MDITSHYSPKDTRVIFMGTPAFALPSLERLLEVGYQVVGVFTAPDSPAGRGREPSSSPVKKFALSRGLKVYQPPSLRRGGASEAIAGLNPDLIVLAAYGILLPKSILDLPSNGALNVHPSLLPKYRGATPIIWPILQGDTETGVTIFLMDVGMDSGPILSQKSVPLHGGETTGSLTGLLAEVGANLLVEAVPKWLDGEIVATPQDDAKASVTRLLKKEDGLIDWRSSAVEIERCIRAYTPWPGTFTAWQGRILKVLSSSVRSQETGCEAGTVVQIEGHGNAPVIAVQTGNEVLALDRVQLEGRKAMAALEFVRGQRGFVGSVLGYKIKEGH